MINIVAFCGRLYKDPPAVEWCESNNSRKPAQKTTLHLVNNSFIGTAKGAKQTTTFLKVSVWGPKAVAAVKYLRRGSEVTVTGRITTCKILAGTRHIEYPEIIINEVHFGRKPADFSADDVPDVPDSVAYSKGNVDGIFD